jgi:hypothetical protein
MPSRMPRDAGKTTTANLTWAINWDHSTDYVESVYWFLKHADDKGGATGVTKALDDIAKVLARGEKFRCDPTTGGDSVMDEAIERKCI